MILRGVLAIEVHSGLDELEGYLKVTEEYLQKARSEFNTRLDEELKLIPSEERDEFNEFYGELDWNYAEVFPRIMRSSFFVAAYSLLEHKMDIICMYIQKEQGIPTNWRDSRGSTIDQFKRYCKRAGLSLTYDDQNWQEINNYRIIRNCIVHNRGLIKGVRQERELQAYANRKNIIEDLMVGLSIRSQLQIVLTKEYCKDVTKTIWAFLNNVLKAYELQRQEQKVDGQK